jgi:hypothetical protein
VQNAAFKKINSIFPEFLRYFSEIMQAFCVPIHERAAFGKKYTSDQGPNGQRCIAAVSG